MEGKALPASSGYRPGTRTPYGMQDTPLPVHTQQRATQPHWRQCRRREAFRKAQNELRERKEADTQRAERAGSGSKGHVHISLVDKETEAQPGLVTGPS